MKICSLSLPTPNFTIIELWNESLLLLTNYNFVVTKTLPKRKLKGLQGIRKQKHYTIITKWEAIFYITNFRNYMMRILTMK